MNVGTTHATLPIHASQDHDIILYMMLPPFYMKVPLPSTLDTVVGVCHLLLLAEKERVFSKFFSFYLQ